MSNPRKHHYVPQFYLSGFTAEPGSSRLHVLDKEARRSYPSRINDAACERDFYIVEVEDEGDPFAVEKFFSTIEASGAEALRFIIEHRSMPDGELYRKFIAFLAVMTIRGPGVIDMIEKPFAQIIKSMLWYATSSKEAFEKFIADGNPEGKAQIEGMTFEEARDFIRSDKYTVSMGQNFKLSLLFTMLEPAELLLAARNWSVVTAADDAPEFICSDRPSTLCWTTPVPGPIGLALGMQNTTAMFPLSRRLALLGLFEKVTVPPALNAKAVGVLNMYTAMYAKRFVYSGTDDFTVTLADGSAADRAGFLSTVKTEVTPD